MGCEPTFRWGVDLPYYYHMRFLGRMINYHATKRLTQGVLPSPGVGRRSVGVAWIGPLPYIEDNAELARYPIGRKNSGENNFVDKIVF